ncbi:MAG TPA: SpoIIE family protein phosphatase, partial [Bryobacteraceae bacterium]|nr:SpoIIE family protein phosphatase [Bryobacteraceae bacterium]
MTTPAQGLDPASRTIRSLTTELLAAYEELSLLYSLTAQVGGLTSEQDIITAALREAMQVIPADDGWVVHWHESRPRTTGRMGGGIAEWDPELIAEAVLAPIRAKARAHVLFHDLASECGVEQCGNTRLLACSLSTGKAPDAYLCLARSAGQPIFTSADQKLMGAVSAVAAMALENLSLHRSELDRRRLEHELDMARRIQRSLLPRDFGYRSFVDAAGESLPCLQIGGDYYDFVPVSDYECLCVIADVAGKGPAAALAAAMVQGNVQALCRDSVELPRLLTTMNACFRSRAQSGSFVTVFAGVLDKNGRFRYTNGGHNPPLLVRRTGEVAELAEGGPLLGFFEHAAYREGTAQLVPGDLVFLYTDGLT